MDFPFKVKKRDGGLEDFAADKIHRVVVAAGLTAEQAKLLVERIVQWARGHREPHLSSLTIRDRVLAELRKIHAPAAGMFAWYQKTKEKHS